MGTGQDSVKVMAVVDKPEKEKVLSKKKNGFWFRFKLMFSCISSRSKVDSSTLVGNNNNNLFLQVCFVSLFMLSL